MNPREFEAKWNSSQEVELVRYPPESFSGFGLPEVAVEFMSSVGLPTDAAPFLSFEPPKMGRLQTVAESWCLDASFARWIQIGSNGSGDPIAIDANSPTGAVYYLNHDDDFRPRLMAGSIECLAYILLYFRDLVDHARERGGTDAFLEGRIPHDVVSTFFRRLQETDPVAAVDSMWLDEVHSPAA